MSTDPEVNAVLEEAARAGEDTTELLRAASAHALARADRWTLGQHIMCEVQHDYLDLPPIGMPAVFSSALVGRLRIEGNARLADRLVALLGGGSPYLDPLLFTDEAYHQLALNVEAARLFRAKGDEDTARSWEREQAASLAVVLRDRLTLDGRKKLSGAIGEAFDPPPPGTRRERHRARTALPRDRRLVEPVDQAVRIAGNRSPEVLGHAHIESLLADGRLALAGAVMVWWARLTAGPIVDPAPLAAQILERLWMEGKPELAETFAGLIRGVPMARNPNEIMIHWRGLLAAPWVSTAPIAHALVRSMRGWPRDQDLAEAVEALLIDAKLVTRG